MRVRLHPLHVTSLLFWLALMLLQLGLLLPSTGVNPYWAGLLVLLLLLPARGLFGARRYTYRWVGFLVMFYFCIGISELWSAPTLRFYAGGTTVASVGLFFSSIYFARYLGLNRQRGR